MVMATFVEKKFVLDGIKGVDKTPFPCYNNTMKGVDSMSKSKSKKPKTWVEIVQSQRREFPQGCCVTKVIPDKRRKPPKYKGKGWEE